MNRPLFKKVFQQVLAWTALVALCGAVALAQSSETVPSPASPTRTDGQIEMDVVHALDASTALKQDLITAATIQSEVTLSGTVSSKVSRDLAESIASHVPGVSKVNNNLKVGSPQAAASAGDQQPAENPPEESAQAAEPAPPPAPAPGESPQPAPDQSQAQPLREPADEDVPPPPPPARPRYAPARPQAPVYEAATGPVTVPQGTLLQLRTMEPIRSKKAKEGTPVQFIVIHDVAIGGVLAIPRGATVHGVVTEAVQGGALAGGSELALKLTSLEMGGQSYPLDTYQFKVKGPGKGAWTANNVVGGTVMGTIVGCIAGRGIGCAAGAAAGGGLGVAASAAGPRPGIWIPAEARVDFHLKTPLTVTPVSLREAARLAQGLYQGGPALYRRGYYPYGRPYPYGYYPYGYPPPVYYRPY